MDVLAPPAPWFAPYDATCEGVDWQRNHEAAAVDVASFQLWPDDWLVAAEPWKLHWSRRWVRTHSSPGTVSSSAAVESSSTRCAIVATGA